MTKIYRKYQFTAQMDEAIRRAYIERPAEGAIPGVKDLSDRWRIPTWTIKRRAGELGLTRMKNAVWSVHEIEMLEKLAHLPCAVISRKFAAQFFFRSATSIKLKIKRLKIRRSPSSDVYNVTSLADCFGVDSSTVLRWIREGILKAEVLQTRADGQETRLIRERDVLAFIVENPMQFDIRKVDQIWFVDLLSDGKIGNSIQQAIKH